MPMSTWTRTPSYYARPTQHVFRSISHRSQNSQLPYIDMKTAASLVIAVTLARRAASTAQNANPETKSSLRGASSNAPRHLQVPPNEICFTHLGYYRDDATYPYQTACTDGLLSQCGPFDASNCVAGADSEGDDCVYKYLQDVHCPTFVVWPTGDSECAWAYTCCTFS
jgi:hypothetical protein